MAEDNKSGVNNFNPNKQISTEMVLDILLKHKNAMYKAYYGKDIDYKEEIRDNERIVNQFLSLREMMSSQMLIIYLIARPTIEENCVVRYNKKYKTKEEKEEHPFKNEENDIKKLIECREFSLWGLDVLRKADLTPTLDDDFMVTRVNAEGQKENHLTKNFDDMRNDLAENYNKIYRLLIEHEIVTKRQQEDEGLTYEEQTEMFIGRFVEA